MDRRKFLWELAYYLMVLLITWYVYHDGLPLRVQFWYYTHRTSRTVARTFGRIGLTAEARYHRALEEEQHA